jgi:hypothetical protein
MSRQTTITIQFCQADLANLQGQFITVVGGMSGEESNVVTCASFAPFGTANTLLFSAQWEVFAFPSAITPFNPVNLQIEQPATVGSIYDFTGTRFSPDSNAGLPAAFGCYNESTLNPVGFGIAQSLTANAGTPFWAPWAIMEAPAKETSYLQPLNTVALFLSTIGANIIIPAGVLRTADTSSNSRSMNPGLVIGNCLTVSLESSSTVYFDSRNNCFTTTSQACN